MATSVHVFCLENSSGDLNELVLVCLGRCMNVRLIHCNLNTCFLTQKISTSCQVKIEVTLRKEKEKKSQILN